MGGTRIKRSICGAAVVAALLAVVPAAQAVRVKVDGHLYGMMPAAGGALTSGSTATPRSASASGSLTPSISSAFNVFYQGGPVLHTTSPYAIYWDPSGTGISLASKHVINQYLTDVAADSGESDSVYGVGRQYYDSQGFADAGQTFSASQALTDQDPYPASGCPVFSPYTSCITDAQLKDELSAFIAANGLPTDGPSTASELPAQAPVYFVMLPANVDTCTDSFGSQCSDGSAYCAYHSYYVDSNNNRVLYSNVPFSVFTANPSKGCQADAYPSTFQAPNGNQADNIVDNLSHELNEVITDPVLNAWVNIGGDGNELADQCAQYGASPDPVNGASPNAYAPVLGGSEAAGTLYDQLINGDRYYTQSLWSNGQADCELQPTAAALTASFTLPAFTFVGHSVSADPSGTLSQAGIANTTWDWGDGTTSAVAGGSPASHTFSSAGVHTVTLTVADAYGNIATTSRQVSVGSVPTVAIGSLPGSIVQGVAVPFSAGSSTDTNAGANPSFSWNFGDGTSATGVTALHSYNAPGIYTVTLTLTDAYGFNGLKTATLDVVAARILKLSHTGHGRSTRLLVTVNAPGKLLYGGRTIDLAAAGTAKLKIALTAKQKRALAKHHKFWVTARIAYAPRVGSRVTEDISVKL